MQLVAYGAQDIYLTGNPQITYWKVVYRRPTNFAKESIEQIFSGEADFGKKVTCTLSRNGDLVQEVYFQVELPALELDYLNDPTDGTGDYDQIAYTNSIGHALIENVEVEIGGQRIDRHFGVWLEIWDELTQTSEKELGYNQMVGKQAADIGLKGTAGLNRIYYVPLQFWFNRNPGLALPLIALQYHEVRITIQFRSALECIVALQNDGDRITSGTGSPGNGFTLSADGRSNVRFQHAQLYVDYVYLDTEERRRFAQESHEYLIDQLQQTGIESVSLNLGNPQYQYRMNFNHPVKENVWVLQRSVNAPQNGGNVAQNDWFNFSTSDPGETEPAPYTGDILNPLNRSAVTILLNGHERFQARPATYFRLVQPYQSHTRTPAKHIYVYAYGLRPEEHQPSGTVNMSRIDNAQLVYTLSDNAQCAPSHATSPYGNVFSSTATGTLTVFARNYNVLRIDNMVHKSNSPIVC